MSREIVIDPYAGVVFSRALNETLNTLSGFDGFATEFQKIRIIAPDGDTSNDATAVIIANMHSTLVVAADLATINTVAPNDVATITCSDAAIAADTNVDYVVWQDGVQQSAGSKAVVGGVVTLTFSSGSVGRYVIEIKRQGATDYETGYIEIEVL